MQHMGLISSNSLLLLPFAIALSNLLDIKCYLSLVRYFSEKKMSKHNRSWQKKILSFVSLYCICSCKNGSCCKFIRKMHKDKVFVSECVSEWLNQWYFAAIYIVNVLHSQNTFVVHLHLRDKYYVFYTLALLIEFVMIDVGHADPRYICKLAIAFQCWWNWICVKIFRNS